ncbi:hypothetical protein QJS10_CPA08g00896 [Acorus calamus]|uniref:Uncharacterized protein n=1 Tax=Acorus calamus TaxID=4465 RepID=A0AAV9EAD7_ACOCL|nr:hypothetical protein QJS10_CPA08g00896 [Acorus calamus]
MLKDQVKEVADSLTSSTKKSFDRGYRQGYKDRYTNKDKIEAKAAETILSQKELDIQMMLAADVHLGMKICDFQMECYIFKRRTDEYELVEASKKPKHSTSARRSHAVEVHNLSKGRNANFNQGGSGKFTSGQAQAKENVTLRTEFGGRVTEADMAAPMDEPGSEVSDATLEARWSKDPH